METEIGTFVPLIHSLSCRPELTCQKLSYRDCGEECTKYPPGHVPEAGDVSRVSEDEFPICNPPPVKDDTDTSPGVVNGFIDETDCEGHPCTCHAADYTLWMMRTV